MDRRRLLGVALAVVSACGYGSGALFAKSVYEAGVDWLALLFWRFLVGGLLVWAWVVIVGENRAELRALAPRRSLVLLGLGAFFFMNAATYYASLQYVSASLAALIVYIYPALVAVLSIRWGHGLQGRRPWLALALVSAGVVMAIGGIQVAAEPIGIALIVASPIIYSVYIILTARVAGERRGETAASRTGGAGAETRPAVAAALMLTGTFVVVAALAVPAGEPVLPGQIPSGRVVRPHRHRRLLDGGRDLGVLRGDGPHRRGPDGARLHRGADLDDHAGNPDLRGVAGPPPAPWRSLRHRRGHPGPDNARRDDRGGRRGAVGILWVPVRRPGPAASHREGATDVDAQDGPRP